MSRWNFLWLLVLYGCVMGLALMVAGNRHNARQVSSQMQQYDKERDRLSAEWSRLKLEQSTLLNQVRVESRATDELGMHKPSAANIKVIRE